MISHRHRRHTNVDQCTHMCACPQPVYILRLCGCIVDTWTVDHRIYSRDVLTDTCPFDHVSRYTHRSLVYNTPSIRSASSLLPPIGGLN